MKRLMIVVALLLLAACGNGGDDVPRTAAASAEDELRRMVREEVQRALAERTAEADAPCDVASAAARALPSIVRVDVRDSRTGDLLGSGTGFVGLAGGIVLTAAHVTGTAPKVEIVTGDGRRMVAEVLRADPIRDVAVLRAPDRRLPAMRWAETASLALGEPVRVVGFPFGRTDVRVTGGVLSGRARSEQRSRLELHTDADVDPGDSGGPLLTACGEALGLIAGRQAGSSTITVAVSADTALPFALEAVQSP